MTTTNNQIDLTRNGKTYVFRTGYEMRVVGGKQCWTIWSTDEVDCKTQGGLRYLPVGAQPEFDERAVAFIAAVRAERAVNIAKRERFDALNNEGCDGYNPYGERK